MPYNASSGAIIKINIGNVNFAEGIIRMPFKNI